MTGGRARWRARTWPLLLIAFTFCGGTSEAELRCAEAVARLEACCPGFDDVTASFGCEAAAASSCGGGPVVSLDDSACILAQSCESLQSSLVCARAAIYVVGGAPWPVGAPQGLCP